MIQLSKAEKGKEYWPKLLSTPKPNFLKTDFSRWKDEDEDDEEMAGMPGMGGMPGMPGMNFGGMRLAFNTL